MKSQRALFLGVQPGVVARVITAAARDAEVAGGLCAATAVGFVAKKKCWRKPRGRGRPAELSMKMLEVRVFAPAYHFGPVDPRKLPTHDSPYTALRPTD